MKNLFYILIFIGFTSLTQAQSYTLAPSTAIENLVQSYKKYNFSKENWAGWRIQLIATTDRNKMENTLGRWRALYPAYEARWFHSAPYYIIRVGAFTKRLEAVQFLQKIKSDFSGAYPAKDKSILSSDFFMDY